MITSHSFKSGRVFYNLALHVTEDQLQEVAEMSGVLEVSENFLDDAFRLECERHIPNTDEIIPAEASNAYLFLKANFEENRV